VFFVKRTAHNKRLATMPLLGLARPIQFTSLGPPNSLNSKDGTAASRGRYLPLMQLHFLIRIFICFSAITSVLCNSKQNSDSNKNLTDSSQTKRLVGHYASGKQLFVTFCNKCHNNPERYVNDDFIFEQLFDRLPAPAEEYLVRFLKDSKSLKASGDQHSQQIDDRWSTDYEHFFKDSITEEGFSNLVFYLKAAERQRYSQ